MVSVVVAGVAAVVMGVPTGIVRTDFYHRLTPVLWWNYPEWALSAALIGLMAATFVGGGVSSSTPVTGGFLSTLAVGCPICNKAVVAAVGVSGALNIWAPIQPWLGVGSIALLGYALRQRLYGKSACPVR